MIQFGTLIKKLAAKAGIKADDPKLIELLSVNALIPDEIAGALESLENPGELMSLESAKSNIKLKDHFKASIYNGLDAQLLLLAEESGLSEADIDEIRNEKNTHKKQVLLRDKLVADAGKKYKGSDKQALLDEVKQLNNELQQVKDNNKKQIEQLKEQSNAEMLDYALDSLLANKPYANADIPLDVNVLTAKSLLQKALAEGKGKIVRNGRNLELVNAEDPTQGFFVNNKQVSLRELTDSILATNKLLKVSDPGAFGAGGNKFSKPAGGDKPDTSKVVSAYDKHLTDLGVRV